MPSIQPRSRSLSPQAWHMLREVFGVVLLVCGVIGVGVSAYAFDPRLGVAFGSAFVALAGLWLASSPVS